MPNNPSNNKPEQPKQPEPQNSNLDTVSVDNILNAVETEGFEWENQKDEFFEIALNSAAESRSNDKNEDAARTLFMFFNSQRRELQAIRNKIPNTNQGKGQNKNIRLNQVRERLDSDLKLLDKLQKELNGEASDVYKAKTEALPENVLSRNTDELKKIDSELGKVIKEILSVSSKIEARKKTGAKLSDTEKATFEQELILAKTIFDNAVSSKEKFDTRYVSTDVSDVVLKSFFESIKRKVVAPENGSNVKNQSFDFFYQKAKEALDKSVDESPEKFKKIEDGLATVNAGYAKIKKEIEQRKGKDVKLKDEDKLEIKRMIAENDEKFQAACLEFSGACEPLSIDIRLMDSEQNKIEFEDRDSNSKIFLDFPLELTNKQKLKSSELARSFNYALGYGYKTLESLDDVKHMSAKEQRENAKGVSDRVRSIDKQMSEDYDKLSIGKKLSPDQKEGFEVLLDVEIVNLREAQEELNALPNTPENQPTRNLVESILIRAENRIQELKEKLDKVRVATEKEVMDKLDAAEKEIEKIEANIRDINRKDSEGKKILKLAKKEHKEANSNDQNLGLFRKSMKSLFAPNPSYSNGQTYHNQINVSDDLADPKIYIQDAKDYIANMPENTDKEKKIKTKLMKKARRMKRRVTSTKWRHYLTLDASEKGWYIGDKIGTAFIDKIDDGLDRVLG